jgi:uncharacterized membrane protein
MTEETAAHVQEVRHLAVDRLAALTDGVFAIAITLLSLEVAVPIVEGAVGGEDLFEALIERCPRTSPTR